MEYRIISADDHIDMQWLPRDLWRKRVPQSWRDRAPKVVETADGPYWMCGEDRWDPLWEAAAETGRKGQHHEEPEWRLRVHYRQPQPDGGEQLK